MKNDKSAVKAQRLAKQAHDHADFVDACAHHAKHETSNNALRDAAKHLHKMAEFLEAEYDLEKPPSKRAQKELAESMAHVRGAALRSEP